MHPAHSQQDDAHVFSPGMAQQKPSKTGCRLLPDIFRMILFYDDAKERAQCGWVVFETPTHVPQQLFSTHHSAVSASRSVIMPKP